MSLQRGSRSGFLLDRVFPVEGISLRGPIRGTGTGGKLNLLLLLRILEFKENHLIKKIYIEENNKDKDKLAASSSPNSSPKNSTIKYLLQPKTQLLSLVSRV